MLKKGTTNYDRGIGAALVQVDRIIGYYSKEFTRPELNYTIVEKEYLAMLSSLIHFDSIIRGYYIEIRTDSNIVLRDKISYITNTQIQTNHE
ncbi:hypothetical protein G9O61_00g014100 [Vairimorpha ceranae]|nr:hypothetical protein G9O61_00g014100 [Vairimorpha ceranae]